MIHYNIIIIGLGPAGAVLASGLNSKYSILAIDKKNPNLSEAGFQKPCGGLLAPDAQKALAELSLTIPKNVLVDPQIFSVSTIDFDNDLSKFYQRMYLNLNRHAFDLWLISKIHDNVIKAYSSVVTKIGKDKFDKYIIEYHNEKDEKIVCSSDIIIGADGASSIVRRFLYPKAKFRYYTAIQQWYKNDDNINLYSCIFDSKITNCYSWIVSKDGNLIFGGAYPSKNSRKLFDIKKEKVASKLNINMMDPIKTEACMVLRPKKLKHFLVGKDNAFLIGEAAGFISPSSLEGISSAITSAVALTNILNEDKGNLNRKYKRATKRLKHKLYLKNFKSLFMYRPFLRKLVMKSGIQSVKVRKYNN